MAKKGMTSPLSVRQFQFMGVVIAALIILVVIALIYVMPYVKFAALWLLSVGFFVAMRLPDSWKIGLEVFYLFTFIYSYIFGLAFVLPMIYLALLIVVKIRPDEGNGAFIHTIVLTGMALTARFFLRMYGMSITPSEFAFASLATLAIWLVADTLICIRTAPVPLPKLAINHTMEFMINYLIVINFGFGIFQYMARFA